MAEDRIKISVYFLGKPNFSESACKYSILYLNSLQSTFEFQFPKNESYLDTYSITEEQKDRIKKFREADLNVQYYAPAFFKFDNLLNQNNFKGHAEYHVGIIVKPLENNLFFVSWEKKSIITTDGWDKLFSPPSVFEYIIRCLNASIVHHATSLGSHDETRGCLLDYTYFKEDAKVNIAFGYICDDCSAKIKEQHGEEFLQSIKKILPRKWIGRIDKPDSFAYNLKKYFKVDIEKDSGFNKSFWERAKEPLTELPKEIILILVGALVTILVSLVSIIGTLYLTGK